MMGAPLTELAATQARARSAPTRRPGFGPDAHLALLSAAAGLLLTAGAPPALAQSSDRTAPRSESRKAAAEAPRTPTPRRTVPTPARPKGEMTAPDDVEEIEDVEEVTPVITPGMQSGMAAPPGQVPGSPQGRSLGEWLPKLHAALVHFPIAWLVLLLLVDIRTLAFARPGWERLGLYVLVGTVASLLVASATGLARADQLRGAPDQAALVQAHRNLAFIATGAAAAALALRAAVRNRLGPKTRWVYLGLLGVAVLAVLATGHRGARITFGRDFLPF